MAAANNQAPLDCCLCEELSSREFPPEYQKVYSVTSRICVDSGDFVVLPTLSPLAAGHVLILPKHHVTNLAALPMHSRSELLTCAESVSTQLTESFGSELYFFEHGVTGPGMACGINHAHLHILPLSTSLAETVELQIDIDFPVRDAGGLIQVLSLANHVQPAAYLLHGLGLQSLRISFEDRIPSQYMRRLIVGIDQGPMWDWKMLSGRDKFLSTCSAFRQM